VHDVGCSRPGAAHFSMRQHWLRTAARARCKPVPRIAPATAGALIDVQEQKPPTGADERHNRIAEVPMSENIEKRMQPAAHGQVDWRRVAYLPQLSRNLDHIEETELAPARKVLYQFSARGHDLAQILLGQALTEANDAACGYYRSRPLLLALGVDLVHVLGSAMGRSGGYSGGRDIGVVFNYPNPGGPAALPMCGGVGA